MADIARYDHDVVGDIGLSCMYETSAGDWVEYDEHLSVVERLEAKIAELEADVEHWAYMADMSD